MENKQCTIVFYVDNMKLSHRSPEVITKIIGKFNKVYATINKVTVRRGKIHEYLGMSFNLSQPGECQVSMYDFLCKLIYFLRKFAPNMIGTKPTAAPADLFDTSDDEQSPKLPSKLQEIFHTIIAKFLFLKRGRPDVKLVIFIRCFPLLPPILHIIISMYTCNAMYGIHCFRTTTVII